MAAARELTAAGRQAGDELHTLLDVLRASNPTPAAAPGESPAAHADLSELIAESASAGLSVTLQEHGDPAALSPTVRRTAYRVIREALTNVHKHASDAQVTVIARYQNAQLHIQVDNSAPTIAGLCQPGAGTGLLGLRQRVELMGGRLRAEPTPHGGFLVDAILPTYVPSAAPAGAYDQSPDAETHRWPGP